MTAAQLWRGRFWCDAQDERRVRHAPHAAVRGFGYGARRPVEGCSCVREEVLCDVELRASEVPDELDARLLVERHWCVGSWVYLRADAAPEAPSATRPGSASCPGCGARVELVGREEDLIPPHVDEGGTLCPGYESQRVGYRAGVRAAALAAYLLPETADGEDVDVVLRRLRVEHAGLRRSSAHLSAALEAPPTDEELAAMRAADPAVAWWFAQLRPEAVKEALALFLSVRRGGIRP